MTGRRGSLVTGLAMLVAALPSGDFAAAAPTQAERDLEAVGTLIEAGADALFGGFGGVPADADGAAAEAVPDHPGALAAWEHRNQLRQRATLAERLVQPALQTELELIRQTCGDLPPDARREILAAGRKALAATALDCASREVAGAAPPTRDDIRRGLYEALRPLVEKHAAAADLAAYLRERDQRTRRRARAARIRIVAVLDGQLELSAAQRHAIEADLETHWRDAWTADFEEPTVVINEHRPAPDYAAACIVPHLDPHQQAAWASWCAAAGQRVLGRRSGWHFDAQGLHQPDAWWGE